MTMRPVSLVSVFLSIDEQRPTGHLQSISLWFGYFLLCTLCSRLSFSRFQFTVRLSFSDRWTGFVSDQLVLPTFLILHDFTGSRRRRYYIDSMVHVRANIDRRYAIFGLLRTTLVCCTVFCPNFPDFLPVFPCHVDCRLRTRLQLSLTVQQQAWQVMFTCIPALCGVVMATCVSTRSLSHKRPGGGQPQSIPFTRYHLTTHFCFLDYRALVKRTLWFW